MTASGPTRPPSYDARWGYQQLDAHRYERRRYTGFVRSLNLRMLERALATALRQVPAGGVVLDVPCGTGILVDVLGRRGVQVVGADISPAMLAVARERGGVLGHVRADLERPPFHPRSFDAVVCNRFLTHLPSPTRVAVFRQLAALSRGPLVATVCHPYSLKSVFRGVRRVLRIPIKSSPRLTRRLLVAEASAAGLTLGRLANVGAPFSEVWVAVLR